MSHMVLLLYLAIFAHFVLETSNYTVGIMVSSGAITKHYRLDGLNNRIFFSCSSRGWKIQGQGPAEINSCERSPPGS